MISILVTYYNQEKYVKRSLESVLSQKLTTDFEILVGDDGSQDNTCNIVNEYIQKYPDKIKLFIMERDNTKVYSSVERASYNRLNLLNNAKGDYVCFLDGDDAYCDFTFMQDSINVLENKTDLIGVAHTYSEIFNNGEKLEYFKAINKKYISAKLYCARYYTPAGTIIFRNCFNKEDYDRLMKLKSFDDNDITFYFLNYGNLLYEDKIVYSYYQNEGSIWNTVEDFEKKLINAIDFEIIKKIILSYHNHLISKYFVSLKIVFKNKNRLNEKKYDKYKKQCIPNGLILKLYNWATLNKLEKIKIYLNMLYMSLIYMFFRLKYGIKKIVFRNKV